MAYQSSSPFPKRERSLPVVAWRGWYGKQKEHHCETCGHQLGDWDYITKDLHAFRAPDGSKRSYHVDCNDPQGKALHEMAIEDQREEASRGHKSEMDRYRRSVKRPRRHK